MLKIEASSDTPTDVRFQLSGWISGAHVEELERLLEEASRSGRRLGLDLEAVTLADREAVAFFARGAGRDVRVERCPAFLREWIQREAELRSGSRESNDRNHHV